MIQTSFDVALSFAIRMMVCLQYVILALND